MKRINRFSNRIWPLIPNQRFIEQTQRLQAAFPSFANVYLSTPRNELPKAYSLPAVKNYFNVLNEIEEDTPPPKIGKLDAIFISRDDYRRQGSLSQTKQGRTTQITLLDAACAVLDGAHVLTTGSNNTFSQSQETAPKFFELLDINNGITHYLALDASWWPFDTGIDEVVQKNMLVEMVLLQCNSLFNKAFEKEGRRAIGFTHSYGALSKALALSLSPTLSVFNSCTVMMAPLGTSLTLLAISEAKRTYKGKIVVIRSGIDVLEEALGVRQALLVREHEVLSLPCDFRLNCKSHGLLEMTSALNTVLKMQESGITSFADKYHSGRPGKMSYFPHSDGDSEYSITPTFATQENFITRLNDLLRENRFELNNFGQQIIKTIKHATKLEMKIPEVVTETGDSVRKVLGEVDHASEQYLLESIGIAWESIGNHARTIIKWCIENNFFERSDKLGRHCTLLQANLVAAEADNSVRRQLEQLVEEGKF